MPVALSAGGGGGVLDGGRAATRGAQATTEASATARTEAPSKAMAAAVGVAAASSQAQAAAGTTCTAVAAGHGGLHHSCEEEEGTADTVSLLCPASQAQGRGWEAASSVLTDVDRSNAFTIQPRMGTEQMRR